MSKITKAILPVAGFGTRFLPATKAQPKEMLPIYDTPAIEYIVREAVEAGITDIIMVTGRGKRAIEDHFDRNGELEYTLQAKEKTEALGIVQQITGLANFVYVRQPEPLGDGHALLCAKNLIGDKESVVVLFGDDVVDTGDKPNAVQQLMEVHEATGKSVVMLQEVAPSLVSQYGIVDLEKTEEDRGRIKQLVEKPSPIEAPSNLGVIGKYVLTPEVWDALDNAPVGKGGETRLADAFTLMLENKGSLYGKILDGQRFDTGDKMGFLEATLHFALKREGKKVSQLLSQFVK